jgi:hypothetical protein
VERVEVEREATPPAAVIADPAATVGDLALEAAECPMNEYPGEEFDFDSLGRRSSRRPSSFFSLSSSSSSVDASSDFSTSIPLPV